MTDSARSSSFFENTWPPLVIALIYCLLALFVVQYEIFPVDDDWSYIKAAEHFYHTGDLRFTPWTAPSLVFQIWWSSLFVYTLGFSLNSLVLSTLAISFLGTLFLYFLFRELAHSHYVSLFATLLILFNPFSFPLNFTFFTDQYFLSLFFISTYLYHRGCKDQSDSYLFLGSLVAASAILVRQNGLLLPIAVIIYLVLAEKTFAAILRKGLLSLVLPLFSFVLFTYWLNAIHGPTSESAKQLEQLVANLAKPHLFLIKLLYRPAMMLEFFGLSLIPLSAALLPGPKQWLKKQGPPLLFLFCLSGVIFYLFFQHLGVYPLVYLWMDGFRFAFVSEYGFRGVSYPFLFSSKAVDVLSIVSIAYLVYLILENRQELLQKIGKRSSLALLLTIGTLQFLFLLTPYYKFTRYYLVLVPFFIAILLEATRNLRIHRKVLLAVLCAPACFSFAITQDFLSWNQAKWKLGGSLLSEGIPARKVSGGFCWDGWFSSQYSLEHPHEIPTQKGDIPWWIAEFTPAVDPQYVLSNATVPTGFQHLRFFDQDPYTVFRTLPYYSLFFLDNKKVYVLKRDDTKRPTPGGGRVAYSFLDNLLGASFEPSGRQDEAIRTEVSLAGEAAQALLQTAPSKVTFKVNLPYKPCWLRGAVGVMPRCWSQDGDGVIFRVYLDDVQLENLFDTIGIIGLKQQEAFFSPKGYFHKPRPYFVTYLDPKKDPDDRRWRPFCLDLSRFSGRVLEITFEVDPGPNRDDRCDLALWAAPTIETLPESP